MNEWTITTLKEYFDKTLDERDKVLLREGVATKEEIRALEKVIDELKTSRDKGEGKSTGLSAWYGYIIGALGIVIAIVAIAVALWK